MSKESLAWFHTLPNLRHSEYAVLHYLCRCHHKDCKDNFCFPSVTTIAKKVGRCVRTVQRTIRKLEEKNLIHRSSRAVNGRQTSNLYELNLNNKASFSLVKKRTEVFSRNKNVMGTPTKCHPLHLYIINKKLKHRTLSLVSPVDNFISKMEKHDKEQAMSAPEWKFVYNEPKKLPKSDVQIEIAFGEKIYQLSKADFKRLKTAYPTVDVESELKLAKSYYEAQHASERFFPFAYQKLNKWLSNSLRYNKNKQNKAHSASKIKTPYKEWSAKFKCLEAAVNGSEHHQKIIMDVPWLSEYVERKGGFKGVAHSLGMYPGKLEKDFLELYEAQKARID